MRTLMHTASRSVALALLASLAGCVAPGPADEPEDEAVDAASGALVADRASLPTPAAYWSFDTCAAGMITRVREDSGQGAFGVMSGRRLCSPGRFLSAGDFDGVGDKVEISSARRSFLHFQDRISAAAWVNPRSLTGNRTIVNQWYTADSFLLGIHNGKYFWLLRWICGRMGRARAERLAGVAGRPATSHGWAKR